MVEPVLMHGSGIWRTKSYNVINSVQNKACEYFSSVGKNTSNISTRGDMGWFSCVSKQRISCVRLLCKLIRMDETRTVPKIWPWASRRRKGWNHEVNKTVEILNIQNEVNDLTFSTKFLMKTLKKRLMCVPRKNVMMNCLSTEETKMGKNYELIDNLSKSDVPKHTSPDWFIDRIDVLWLCSAPTNACHSNRKVRQAASTGGK